ncbi:SatD family protein [Neotamlana laminarinivorans]|uniref:SatD family protein n=1 Tax=Neotamlana laminarinivorans TaxID=2883124 RepID=A0A9X1I0J4_9FLAO|nr:SatD family protein [Tamlana laminarinivorans]MCB4797784.1 SatD family protein [Tamlana laminarinivorans]
MIAIITGDIINSRQSEPEQWLNSLKTCLLYFGKTPKTWEIFRGDSFQLEVKPEDALFASFLIKSTIKQYKNIDVRLAIGLGEKNYDSYKITESNGSAFINSGECFESLKKNTLAIKSRFKNFDITLNLMLELAQLTMNNWTSISSLIIKTSLENPDMKQNELAELLKKSQSNISEGLKRGGFDEILKLLDYYKNQIQQL